jgi:SAM-dependent methyltransferase
LFERREHMTEGAKTGAAPKGHKGIGMEGFIATWYARQTAKDIDEFRSTARRLAAHIKADDRVLEIAPGPGYLAIELQKLTRCRMVGVDISHTFVRIATENANKAGVDISSISSCAAPHSRTLRNRSRHSMRCIACSSRAAAR